MKVAIVYPPLGQDQGHPHLGQNRQFRYTHSRAVKIYPIVPATAATLLKQNGIDVLYLDGINLELSDREYEQRLEQFGPDLVMLETKAPVIDLHWQYMDKYKAQHPDTILVLVGDHVTAFPDESLERCQVDYVLLGGDYDVSLLQLVRHIEDAAPLPGGAHYRQDDGILNTGPFEMLDDLDQLPFIDRDLTMWQNYGEAYLYKPCTYIMSGRGCGRSDGGGGVCTFCIWQQNLWQRIPRLRSPENVVAEIDHLVNSYGVAEIFDDNDGGAVWSLDWLRGFHREMKRRGLIGRVHFSCNARADSLTPEACDLMKRTGFRLLKVGLESGNDETLRRLNKRESVEEIKRGIKTAKDAGLRILITTMVGYPWETEEQAHQTYQVAKELMTYKARAGDSLQSSVIVPYPGTPLYHEAMKNGWLLYGPEEYAKYDMSGPVLKTEVDTDHWCARMWRVHYEPLFLAGSFFSIRSFDDIRLLLGGVSSLWGHISDYQSRSTEAGLE